MVMDVNLSLGECGARRRRIGRPDQGLRKIEVSGEKGLFDRNIYCNQYGGRTSFWKIPRHKVVHRSALMKLKGGDDERLRMKVTVHPMRTVSEGSHGIRREKYRRRTQQSQEKKMQLEEEQVPGPVQRGEDTSGGTIHVGN